jgi:group I intron endonuclease
MKKQFGLIYKVTNLNNNKIYIGQTIQTLPCRKSKHKQRVFKSDRKTYFYNAIRKHGWGNFKWEILGYCNNKKELDKAEIACIKFFKSTNKKYGYNSTKGGDGLSEPIESVREKLREHGKSRTNFKHTEETKEQIKQTVNEYYQKNDGPNKGKKFSKESKKRMSIAQKRIWRDPDYREHMLKKRKEVWEDEEYRARMSKTRKENMTEELREKFSKITTGGNNPRAIKLKINDTVYDCIKDVAIALDIPAPTLYSRINKYKQKNKFPEGWSLI